MAEITANLAADAATVVVREVEANVVELQAPSQPAVVEVVTPGPQGPPGTTSLAGLTDVNVGAVANRSTLIYDAITNKWIGSSQTTIDEVLNGGNF